MKKHFIINVFEWAKEKTEGFSYNELISYIRPRQFEQDFLNKQFHAAHENTSRYSGTTEPILETIFFVVNKGNNYTDEVEKFTLTPDALFKIIDYEELSFARRNAKEARRLSLKAIWVSVWALIVSAAIPVALFLIDLAIRLWRH